MLSKRLVFLLFILTAVFQTSAQPFCGNFSNPNRRNKVSITDLETESQQWQVRSEPGVFAKIHFREVNDSVVVYRNGVVSGQFLSHNDQIISPCLVLRDEKGNLQSVDSFLLPRTRPGELYYGNFTAVLSMHREYYSSGIPSSVCYKNTASEDSLTIEWSPDGIIRRRKLNETEEHYTADGILSMKCIENDTMRYTNGIITYVAKDTIILYQLVRHVREYSAKGTLLKEKWFKDQKPVATWREYNGEGVLVKTIKHPALVAAPFLSDVPEMAYDEVYAFATEDAQYPGGMVVFNNYMKPELQFIFSSGDLPFQGEYKIRFEVGEDGMPKFVSVQGENAANTSASLKSVFEKMPRWKAGRRSGIAVNSGMILTIRVSEQ